MGGSVSTSNKSGRAPVKSCAGPQFGCGRIMEAIGQIDCHDINTAMTTIENGKSYEFESSTSFMK